MINYNNHHLFIHPEDAAALERLKNFPLLPTLVKTVFKVFDEQLQHGLNMANKIRLGPSQLPTLYNLLPPIVAKLEIPEPEFYLEMNPAPNAYTFGDSRVYITVTSGLLDLLEEDEVRAVLAHECGHIACRHMLYHSIAHRIALYGLGFLGPDSPLTKPVLWSLMAWSRRSEFSADRAAAYVMGGAMPVVETMVRLAGGPKSLTAQINVEEYLRQAEAYDQLQESNWDSFLQTMAILQQSHPFHAVRAREIDAWCRSEEFVGIVDADKSLAFTCPACGGTVGTGWSFCTHCGRTLEEISLPTIDSQ